MPGEDAFHPAASPSAGQPPASGCTDARRTPRAPGSRAQRQHRRVEATHTRFGTRSNATIRFRPIRSTRVLRLKRHRVTSSVGLFLGRGGEKRDVNPGGGFAAVRAIDLPTGRGPPISSAKGRGRGRHIRAPKVPSRERILGGGRRVVMHKPRSTPPPACAQAPVPGQSSRRPATRCVRKAATGIPRHQRRPCHRRPSPPTEQTTPVEDPRRRLDEGMRRGDSGRQKSIRFRSKRRSWSHCANEKKLVERRKFLDCTETSLRLLLFA
jgi:hypothetical protein